MLSKKPIVKFARIWFPALFWSLSIYVLSSLPGADFSPDQGMNFVIRKVLHFVEYAILLFTYYRGTKNLFVSVSYAVFFAAFDEIHQSFVPSRTGKLSDFLLDSFSVGFTSVLLWKYSHILPKTLINWLKE